MGRAVAVAVLALCACHKAPARIYTDKELADLEQRVLAEVAKTDPSCSHQELLDIDNAVDEQCSLAISKVRRDADAESVEVGKIDEMCGPKVLEAFGRAAASSPGCSPDQVGVRGEMVSAKMTGGFIGQIYATKVLIWHALRETDHYVGLMELFMAFTVGQDLGRGRINIIEAMKSDAMVNTLAAASQKLLSQASLTPEQLADAAAMLDATISLEPSFGATLDGEGLSVALHSGLARLKPKDWQPPGGRTDSTSWKGAFSTDDHDSHDDAGMMMDTGLRRIERNRELCPASASLAACHANLRAHDTPTDWNSDLAKQHAARVRVFPDDKTRRESHEQIIAAWIEPDYLEDYVGKRGLALSHLVALRLRLQVLIDGHCPSEAQLTAPPWSTLSAPAVLGDFVRVTKTADSLVVAAPPWATTTSFVPKGPAFPPPLPKPQPVSIPCP